MPDPNVSDRERLLRLIDGGPEALKEVQQQREAAPEKKPVAVVPAAAAPKIEKTDFFHSWKTWWTRSGLDVSSLIKMTLAVLLLLLAIRSFMDVVQSMGKKGTVAPLAGPGAVVAESMSQDETGTGLRLVGVDWGDEPVALLEDLKTGKTYFARKNEKIKETRIKQIFKDKVLASFRGNNVELR